MLSRAGFIAIGAFETLANPDRAYSHLRLAMNEYGVWRELGKMPRNVLPERKVEREREKSLTMSEKCDVMEKGEQEILYECPVLLFYSAHQRRWSKGDNS